MVLHRKWTVGSSGSISLGLQNQVLKEHPSCGLYAPTGCSGTMSAVWDGWNRGYKPSLVVAQLLHWEFRAWCTCLTWLWHACCMGWVGVGTLTWLGCDAAAFQVWWDVLYLWLSWVMAALQGKWGSWHLSSPVAAPHMWDTICLPGKAVVWLLYEVQQGRQAADHSHLCYQGEHLEGGHQ